MGGLISDGRIAQRGVVTHGTRSEEHRNRDWISGGNEMRLHSRAPASAKSATGVILRSADSRTVMESPDTEAVNVPTTDYPMTYDSIQAAKEATRQEREHIYRTTGIRIEDSGQIRREPKDAGRYQRPA